MHTERGFPTRLDKLEQTARIAATLLVPLILAVGGWYIQSAIEANKEHAAALAAAQQQALEKERNEREQLLKKEQVSLEYVKLAKDILTASYAPKELTRWSWQLLNDQAPTKFNPDDLKELIERQEKIPSLAPSTFRCVDPGPLSGFVLNVQRIRTERRPGMDFLRTVGSYSATYEGQKLQGLTGATVERGGPGDNSKIGVASHRRIEACTYALSTYGGAGGKFATIGFPSAGGLPDRPWPAIGINGTGDRVGIIIHPAAGYLMSIGTIILSKPLDGSNADIDFADSRERVAGLIAMMREKLGSNFPTENGVPIPNAWIVISDEPS